MDYTQLAEVFLSTMFVLQKIDMHRSINESMRGGHLVLHYLYRQKRPILPSEIGQYMKISSARVAVVLNNLEKKNLLTRRIDPNDRRKILVELTDEGKDMSRAHERKILENTTELFRMLGEHDSQEFVRIMTKIADVVIEKQKAERDSSCLDCP